VIEEMDETILWLELLRDGEILPGDRLASLFDESNQLLRIFAATRRTSRAPNRKSQITNHK
jgi:hypothetical protein